jgi:hypothetical protein
MYNVARRLLGQVDVRLQAVETMKLFQQSSGPSLLHASIVQIADLALVCAVSTIGIEM